MEKRTLRNVALGGLAGLVGAFGSLEVLNYQFPKEDPEETTGLFSPYAFERRYQIEERLPYYIPIGIAVTAAITAGATSLCRRNKKSD